MDYKAGVCGVDILECPTELYSDLSSHCVFVRAMYNAICATPFKLLRSGSSCLPTVTTLSDSTTVLSTTAINPDVSFDIMAGESVSVGQYRYTLWTMPVSP